MSTSNTQQKMEIHPIREAILAREALRQKVDLARLLHQPPNSYMNRLLRRVQKRLKLELNQLECNSASQPKSKIKACFARAYYASALMGLSVCTRVWLGYSLPSMSANLRGLERLVHFAAVADPLPLRRRLIPKLMFGLLWRISLVPFWRPLLLILEQKINRIGDENKHTKGGAS
jgi:hypothetical protein